MKTFIYLKQFVFDLNKIMFHSCPNVARFDKNIFFLKEGTLYTTILEKWGGTYKKIARMKLGRELFVADLPPFPRWEHAEKEESYWKLISV